MFRIKLDFVDARKKLERLFCLKKRLRRCFSEEQSIIVFVTDCFLLFDLFKVPEGDFLLVRFDLRERVLDVEELRVDLLRRQVALTDDENFC